MNLGEAARRDVDEFYRQYVHSFIHHDIIAGIRGRANYMVALALVACTEFLGGILLGEFSPGTGRKKFDSFVTHYFPQCYSKTELDIRTSGRKRTARAHATSGIPSYGDLSDGNRVIFCIIH